MPVSTGLKLKSPHPPESAGFFVSWADSQAFCCCEAALREIEADEACRAQLLCGGHMNDVHRAVGLWAGVAHTEPLCGWVEAIGREFTAHDQSLPKGVSKLSQSIM